jgi:proteasome accessory factor B
MLIQSGQRTTPSELAEECGVDERTIYRDLRELEGVGFGITFDRRTNRYTIDKDCFLPPVQLTVQESLALATLCEHIAQFERIPFTKPAWRGLAKIEAALPQSVRDEVYALTQSQAIQTTQVSDQDGFQDVYEVMQQAVATKSTLVCQYESVHSGASGQPDFDFDPYSLFFSVRAWYVIGFHHGRDAMRTLKLNRFCKAQMTKHQFEVPEDFSVDGHLGNAWRMMQGDDQQIEIRFKAGFADTISDTIWHKTQQIDYHESGEVTLRFTVSGFDEIVWWILSMGPNCTVVAPEALRQKVCELASQAATLYD